MRSEFVALAYLALSAASIIHVVAVPLSEFEDLEIVPVAEIELPVRRAQSRIVEIPLVALSDKSPCNSNGMSAACQAILDRAPKADPTEESYAFGDGYYKDYEDIDENADVGVLEMPYQLDYDLLQSHLTTITGGEPCGACEDSSASAVAPRSSGPVVKAREATKRPKANAPGSASGKKTNGRGVGGKSTTAKPQPKQSKKDPTKRPDKKNPSKRDKKDKIKPKK